MNNDLYFRYVCILAMQALDILSGFLKCRRKRIKLLSAKMASGLYKKMGFLLCMVVADILSVISAYYNLGINITIPIFLYMVATESLSIYENTNDAKLIQMLHKILKEWLKDD